MYQFFKNYFLNAANKNLVFFKSISYLISKWNYVRSL